MITDIKNIIKSFKDGEMIILVDDEDRENEGDLIISAEHLTTCIFKFEVPHIIFKFINFMNIYC